MKQFGQNSALRGIGFKVRRGSIHGFLGPNGAGKTTTIKIILGLIAADAGEVSVLGMPLKFGQKLDYLRYTTYLPQDPVFPEGLTGKEALTLVASIYRIEKKLSQTRIDRLLKHFQLADAANRRVSTYSRGMQQRLGIAAVLLPEPELLILDEPVSALDPEGRRKILEIISRLRNRATVFFSSHILADVEKVCDHITIIDRGRKLLDAGTGELLNRYAMEQYLIAVRSDQQAEAATMIRKNPAVREASPQQGKLLVISKPGESIAMTENLLPALVRKGIIVTEFAPNRTNLEEAFFRVLDENHRREVDRQ